jgi:hypothetical protein
MAFGPSLRELSLLLLLLCSFFTHTISWRQWNYSVTSTTSSEVWLTQWSKATGEDIGKIPRPRRGHSLVLAGDYLVMFGGRGNEAEMVHIPRTYNVQKVPDPFPSLTFISSTCSPSGSLWLCLTFHPLSLLLLRLLLLHRRKMVGSSSRPTRTSRSCLVRMQSSVRISLILMKDQ